MRNILYHFCILFCIILVFYFKFSNVFNFKNYIPKLINQNYISPYTFLICMSEFISMSHVFFKKLLFIYQCGLSIAPHTHTLHFHERKRKIEWKTFTLTNNHFIYTSFTTFHINHMAISCLNLWMENFFPFNFPSCKFESYYCNHLTWVFYIECRRVRKRVKEEVLKNWNEGRNASCRQGNDTIRKLNFVESDSFL